MRQRMWGGAVPGARRRVSRTTAASGGASPSASPSRSSSAPTSGSVACAGRRPPVTLRSRGVPPAWCAARGLRRTDRRSRLSAWTGLRRRRCRPDLPARYVAGCVALASVVWRLRIRAQVGEAASGRPGAPRSTCALPQRSALLGTAEAGAALATHRALQRAGARLVVQHACERRLLRCARVRRLLRHHHELPHRR